jgi:hypothetical protein
MDVRDFVFVPLPPVADETVRAAVDEVENPLGPLSDLPGTWTGTGFNTIWRPLHDPGHPSQDRFLELNLTDDTITFEAIGGRIPNRGLFQPDIFMFGLTYLQKINDHNLSTPRLPVGLHIEPGVWAVVPPTSHPPEPQTVVRMGSIPHGTAILAQGIAKTTNAAPVIPSTKINPLSLDNREPQFPFPEQNLSVPTSFRSPPAQLKGITQAMVDDPNSVLTGVIGGQTVIETTMLQVSTAPKPVLGGGTANTAFLEGSADPHHGQANADAVEVTATFWIEKVRGNGEPDFLQLQYTQTVLLQFGAFFWPHVTVGTLRKRTGGESGKQKIDPQIPEEIRAQSVPRA